MNVQVGMQAYFEFKDPYDKLVKNILNNSGGEVELTVVSKFAMKDYITNIHRDPFTDVYNPVGLSEVEYKQDLADDVKVITFMFLSEYNTEIMFRIPETYISSSSNPNSVKYAERAIVVALPSLPVDLEINHLFADFSDFIQTRLGVSPKIKDVTSNDLEEITIDDHQTRETIRKKTVSVKKTLMVQLEEVTNDKNAILNRLSELNISLGGKR